MRLVGFAVAWAVAALIVGLCACVFVIAVVAMVRSL